jgi:hypothetical protein
MRLKLLANSANASNTPCRRARFPSALRSVACGTLSHQTDCRGHCFKRRTVMGRGILLWLLGVPIPVIIILLLIFHH